MVPSRWLLSIASLYAVVSFALIADASAQACKSSGSGANASSCDTTNRDKAIKCSAGPTGTYAPCPAEAMPIKSTPLKTFSDLSPYLWVTAPDPNDASKPYSGPFARGTALDPTQTFMIVGNAASTADGKAAKGQKACADQIDIRLPAVNVNDQNNLREHAALQRLKLGQCAMQYILNASADVAHRENSTTLSGEDPANPAARTSLATHGLPIKMKFSGNAEYNANNYLRLSAAKSLENPAVRIDGGFSIAALFGSYNLNAALSSLTSGVTSQATSAANSTLSSVTDQTVGQATAQYQQLQSQYQSAMSPGNLSVNYNLRFNAALNKQNNSNSASGFQNTASNAAGTAQSVGNAAQQTSSLVGGTAQQAQQLTSAVGGAAQQAQQIGTVAQQAQQATSMVGDVAQQASSVAGAAGSLANIGDLGNIAASGGVAGSFNIPTDALGNVTGALGNIGGMINPTQYINSAANAAANTVSTYVSKAAASVSGLFKQKAPEAAEPGFPSSMPMKANSNPPRSFNSPVASIAANQKGKKTNYQFVTDPNHLWSPRWDFEFTEREHYSPLTDQYSEDTKNSVYCAGDRDEKKYLVDVLSFRKEKFEDGMLKNRMAFNTLCYNDQTNLSGPTVMVAAYSYCWRCTDMYCTTAQSEKCWKCFGLTENQKVKEGENPPCATRHDGDDLLIKGYIPGGLNTFNFKAYCTAVPGGAQTSASTLCKDLRAPYIPVNGLTMRYHPDKNAKDEDKQGDELPGGVPEGYTFKEYFKDHMPYPRLWDTGQSIQKTASNDQDPLDTKGQYTAIVGVGREATPSSSGSGGSSGGGGSSGSSSGGSTASSGGSGSGSGKSSNGTTPGKDQRCLYGGWGKDVTIGGMTFKKGDPMTSTTELMLYQARALREHNLNGMLSYEKGAGQRGSEAQLLKRAGGTAKLVMACKKGASDNDQSCRFIGDDGGSPKIEPDEIARYKEIPIPMQWRGYVSDPVDEQKFPKLGGGGKGLYTGLDNAKCGDFIIMPHGGGTESSPGLPSLARVIGINLPSGNSCNFSGKSTSNNCGSDCYVDVEEADGGKFPDVCGATSVAGSIQKRRMYKSANPARPFDKEMARIKWTTSCEDPGMNECVLSTWDSLQLYRASEDRRMGASDSGSGSSAKGSGG